MTAAPGSAREGVEFALARIGDIDPLVNSVCTLNPAALDDAVALDAEVAAGRSRGPLHGRPILVKDNVDTAGLLTTAGSLALADTPPSADAPLVRRLRDAGMVVLGKTNLSEWANMRDESSTSGWSAYGGLTRNPYALNRSSGGSSSGSGAAVAARLAPYAIGTETDGSITCPAAYNGCVGIKPTVGLVPAHGIVPISKSQDTPGPLAMTVPDAAQVLTVLAGNGVDYAAHAQPGRLAGKRIGLPRKNFWGYSVLADQAAERAVELLSAEGATIVDATDVVSMVDYGFEDELLVLLSELRAGLADYLATRPDGAPRTLADVVEFNRARAAQELAHFGQSFFEQALDAPTLDSEEYRAARAACLAHGRDDGIDAVLREHQLDALLTPSYNPTIPIDLVNAEHHWGSCTQPAAMAGYPLVTVPSALTHGLPVAVTLWGTAGSEAALIEIAAGYEAARDAAAGPLPPPTYPQFV
ncbi:MAG: amidase family protein [Nocardioidaceae bacterium]